jgi:hypothetical protein
MKPHPVVLALALAACGGPSKPVIPCVRVCHSDYDCPPGEPNPNCEAALADCLDECQMTPEEEDKNENDSE